MLYNRYKEESDQTSNELENILNSTSPITLKILFRTFNFPFIFHNIDKLKLLLEKTFNQSIDPNTKSNIGKTLLGYFCDTVGVDLVPFLLEKGASPSVHNLRVVIKSITNTKKVHLTKLLLQYGAPTELKDELKLSPIQVATREKYTKIVKLLIQYGAEVNGIVPEGYLYAGKNLIELAGDTVILPKNNRQKE